MSAPPEPPCPPPQTLEAFTGGSLPVGEAARIRAHAQGCPTCRATLDARLSHPQLAPTAPQSGLLSTAPSSEFTYARPGDRLGRYMVAELVAEGGMGVVYSAYDPLLDRRVALKVVSGRLDGEETDWQERLLKEAQAMARLSHRNVVSVYDTAVVDGRVCVAMEFVRGRNARGWLSDPTRTWRDALGVYLQAGAGLQAAHEALLVHRDFKPENILICDDGRVAVTDFGLAQAVGATADTSRFVGTVGYLPPEQASNHPLGPAADQFSFCAALWEALYGTRPFEGEGGAAQMAAAMAGLLRAPKRGREVPSRVRAALVRGLSAKPEDRWPSMRPLLVELSKALEPSSGRWLMAAALCGALVLAALAGGRWQNAQQRALCEGAHERIHALFTPARPRIERAFAATQKPWAIDASSRVTGALEAWGKGWAEGHRDACAATRIRKEQTEALMERRMICLDGALRDYAALLGELAVLSPEEAQKADRAVQALPPPSRCAELASLSLRREPPSAELKPKIDELASRIATARAAVQLGRFETSVPALDKAVSEARALGSLDTLVDALEAQALGRYWSDDAEGAVAAYHEAGLKALEARRDADAAEAWAHAVEVQANANKLPEAKRALELTRAVTLRLGPGHDEQVAALHTVEGYVAYYDGDFDRAMKELDVALELRQRLGPDRVETAEILTDVAAIRYERGEYATSLDAAERSVVIWRRAVGERHPSLATAMATLGLAQHALGRFEAAHASYTMAHELHVEAYGEVHSEVATDVNNLGVLAMDEGRYEDAKAHFETTLRIRERTLGPATSGYAGALGNLADALLALEQNAEARVLVERALEIRRKALGPEHPRTLSLLSKLGRVELAEGRAKDAVQTYAALLPRLEKAVEATHPDIARALANFTEAQLLLGDGSAALVHARRAKEIFEVSGKAPSEKGWARYLLARALIVSGDEVAGRAMAKEALAVMQEVPEQHRTRTKSREWLEQYGR